MDPDETILVENVSKTFFPPDLHQRTLKERLTRSPPQVPDTGVEALEDVSFSVRAGECFGIAGHNGCGKSTMLQLLAGIYRVDSGRIRTRGTLAPIIDLGVGFHNDLPAIENLVVNGVLTGLTPEDARARAFRIITFANLDGVVRLKIKNYSSGMRARLAFATMVHTDADLLLLDEVLAVGDAAFRKQCSFVIQELLARGRTAVFVSHQMSALKQLCDRAMLLHHGRVVAIGDPSMVADRYVEFVAKPPSDEVNPLTEAASSGSGPTDSGGAEKRTAAAGAG